MWTDPREQAQEGRPGSRAIKTPPSPDALTGEPLLGVIRSGLLAVHRPINRKQTARIKGASTADALAAGAELIPGGSRLGAARVDASPLLAGPGLPPAPVWPSGPQPPGLEPWGPLPARTGPPAGVQATRLGFPEPHPEPRPHWTPLGLCRAPLLSLPFNRRLGAPSVSSAGTRGRRPPLSSTARTRPHAPSPRASEQLVRALRATCNVCGAWGCMCACVHVHTCVGTCLCILCCMSHVCACVTMPVCACACMWSRMSADLTHYSSSWTEGSPPNP